MINRQYRQRKLQLNYFTEGGTEERKERERERGW